MKGFWEAFGLNVGASFGHLLGMKLWSKFGKAKRSLGIAQARPAGGHCDAAEGLKT